MILLDVNFDEQTWDLTDEEFRELVTRICHGDEPDQLHYGWARWKRVVGNNNPLRSEAKRLRPYILERDGYVCRRCGATDDLQMDHLIPVSRGGTNDLDNLAILCRPCNLNKRAKTWDEWVNA